jgi:hypothetical protein
MPSVWPAALPQLAPYSLNEEADAVTIRSTVDVGLAKLRPRYTAEVKVFSMSLTLTASQVTSLETFWATTLVFGTGEFDWVHPRTLAAATFRFRSRPAYTPLAKDVWSASISLEMLP